MGDGPLIRGSDIVPLDFSGLAIRDYTADVVAASSLATIDVPPGGRHPTAFSQRSEKLYYVVSGSLRFVVDGCAYEVGRGDVCRICCGVRFSYENGSEPAVLLLVHTPPFRLEDEVFEE